MFCSQSPLFICLPSWVGGTVPCVKFHTPVFTTVLNLPLDVCASDPGTTGQLIICSHYLLPGHRAKPYLSTSLAFRWGHKMECGRIDVGCVQLWSVENCHLCPSYSFSTEASFLLEAARLPSSWVPEPLYGAKLYPNSSTLNLSLTWNCPGLILLCRGIAFWVCMLQSLVAMLTNILLWWLSNSMAGMGRTLKEIFIWWLKIGKNIWSNRIRIPCVSSRSVALHSFCVINLLLRRPYQWLRWLSASGEDNLKTSASW